MLLHSIQAIVRVVDSVDSFFQVNIQYTMTNGIVEKQHDAIIVQFKTAGEKKTSKDPSINHKLSNWVNQLM